MKNSCKKSGACKIPVCHDLACTLYSQKSENKTKRIFDVLEERLATDEEIQNLYPVEPLLHRFFIAMDKLGDDEYFITGFILSLLQERVFIYRELLGNNSKH